MDPNFAAFMGVQSQPKKKKKGPKYNPPKRSAHIGENSLKKLKVADLRLHHDSLGGASGKLTKPKLIAAILALQQQEDGGGAQKTKNNVETKPVTRTDSNPNRPPTPESKIRKRGWSVHSATSIKTNDTADDESDSDMECSSSSENDDDGTTTKPGAKKKLKVDHGDGDGDGDGALFDSGSLTSYQLMGFLGDDDDEDQDEDCLTKTKGKSKVKAKTKTKRKTEVPTTTTASTSTTTTPPTAPTPPTSAKPGAVTKLSTWASRFLNPDRPVADILVPEIIPLDSFFLRQFNKNNSESEIKKSDHLEKQDDDYSLSSMDYSNADSDSGDDDDDDNNSNKNGKKKNQISRRQQTSKIRVNNLAYGTTEATLLKHFSQFGKVKSVNLLMDDIQPNRNTGRGYLTLIEEAVDPSDKGNSEAYNLVAKKAIESSNNKQIDGRAVRIDLIEAESQGSKPGATRPRKSLGGGENSQRYWQKDIATKCYACGGVGHIAAKCPNPKSKKPCPYCGIDHGDMRCKLTIICFNCGVSGHERRDCQERRMLAPRRICTTCFSDGHTRYQCTKEGAELSGRGAMCLSCGRSGHFMCGKLKWSSGGKVMENAGKIYCSNCGQAGHLNFQCRRPRLHECATNQTIAEEEIRLAGEFSRMEEVVEEAPVVVDRGRGGERINGIGNGNGNNRGYNNNDNKRKRSISPNPNMTYNSNNNTNNNTNNNNNSNNNNNNHNHNNRNNGGNNTYVKHRRFD